MSNGSSISKRTAVAVLNSVGISKIKKFTFQGHTFSPDVLAMMAWEIENGYMDVVYEPKLSDKAIYNSSENKLYVGFWVAGSISRQALIVHEVTHAMFDFKAAKMDVATSESISYIAQCQYARAVSTSSDPEERLYSEIEAKDKVFQVAWGIAGKLLSGGTVNETDVSQMRQAISGHPEYATDATASAGYNGY